MFVPFPVIWRQVPGITRVGFDDPDVVAAALLADEGNLTSIRGPDRIIAHPAELSYLRGVCVAPLVHLHRLGVYLGVSIVIFFSHVDSVAAVRRQPVLLQELLVLLAESLVVPQIAAATAIRIHRPQTGLILVVCEEDDLVVEACERHRGCR